MFLSALLSYSTYEDGLALEQNVGAQCLIIVKIRLVLISSETHTNPGLELPASAPDTDCKYFVLCTLK